MIVHANIHMNYFGLNYPVQPFFIAVAVHRAVNSNTFFQQGSSGILMRLMVEL